LPQASIAHKERIFDGLMNDWLEELIEAPCLFSPVRITGPVALYGAGSLGSMATEFLNYVGYPPVAVMDRTSKVDVFKNTMVAVSIVSEPYVPIERSLRDRGFKNVVPFYDICESFWNIHPLSNGWFAPEFGDKAIKNIWIVQGTWDDRKSRAHHLQFMAWRKAREEWSFRDYPVLDNRYFIPEIALGRNETFVDGGAHQGSASQEFITRTNGDFHEIIAFEPDKENLKQYEKNIKDTRATSYEYALADSSGIGMFHSGFGFMSKLSANGKEFVHVRRLDEFDLSPTFLKLHLEGGELSALRGAVRTIMRCRPIIAATVYHNSDGIWKTALWLMRTLSDYRFLFRMHGWCGTGAVIYAIPKERQ